MVDHNTLPIILRAELFDDDDRLLGMHRVSSRVDISLPRCIPSSSLHHPPT